MGRSLGWSSAAGTSCRLLGRAPAAWPPAAAGPQRAPGRARAWSTPSLLTRHLHCMASAARAAGQHTRSEAVWQGTWQTIEGWSGVGCYRVRTSSATAAGLAEWTGWGLAQVHQRNRHRSTSLLKRELAAARSRRLRGCSSAKQACQVGSQSAHDSPVKPGLRRQHQQVRSAVRRHRRAGREPASSAPAGLPRSRRRAAGWLGLCKVCNPGAAPLIMAHWR